VLPIPKMNIFFTSFLKEYKLNEYIQKNNEGVNIRVPMILISIYMKGRAENVKY